MTFPVSFRMAGVGAEDQHTAGQQEIQCFCDRFPGCFPAGGDRVIAAREPAEVEHNSPDGLMHKLIHTLMAAAEEACPVHEPFPAEQRFGRGDSLLLHIKSIYPAGRSHSLAKEKGIMTVAQ